MKVSYLSFYDKSNLRNTTSSAADPLWQMAKNLGIAPEIRKTKKLIPATAQKVVHS